MIELNPGDALAYNNRGFCKHTLGDDRGAVADYDKAIELKPSHSLAYKYRGKSKELLGDIKGAANDIAMAVRIKRLVANPIAHAEYFCLA